MRLADEFPRRETAAVCAEFFPSLAAAKPMRDAELALQWLYAEECGAIQWCPPRAGVEIRRDIRKAQVRLRGLRRRGAFR